MPDKYIVNMTEKTAPEDTNLLVVEDAADTKKITFANLLKPTKDMIGNLASLATNHKSTLVGAVNELHDDNHLLTYRGYLSDLSDASILGAQSGYYNLAAATTNIGNFYIYAPILILRRYGDYGNALVIGLNSSATALAFRMVVV